MKKKRTVLANCPINSYFTPGEQKNMKYFLNLDKSLKNLPCAGAAGAHDTFGTRSGDPEHVEVDVGKRGAEGLREGVLEHATDLERVYCVCAV